MNRTLIIFTGSRDWEDRSPVTRALQALKRRFGTKLVIVEGGQAGLDRMAFDCAEELNIDHITVHALWDQRGNGAGPRRNQLMLDLGAKYVFAFHRDIRSSKGTRSMILKAIKQGLHVRLWEGEKWRILRDDLGVYTSSPIPNDDEWYRRFVVGGYRS
jgi:hypothetical protein